MISGAFLLSNKKNKNVKYFYKKSINSIFIPTLVFSIFYLFISEIKEINLIVNHNNSILSMAKPILNLILGRPYYHMWYMFMIMGLYLMIPIIIIFIEKLDNLKNNNIFYIIIFLYFMISGLTTNSALNYGITKIVPYIGYLIMGYKIRQLTHSKKNNFLGATLIIISLVIEALLSYVVFKNYSLIYTSQAEILIFKRLLFSIENFGPFIFLSSILLFYGFSMLKININLNGLSKYTFLIFLVHAFIIDILYGIISKYKLYTNNMILVILIFTALAFLISWLISYVYQHCFKNINNSLNLYFIKLFKLS